MSRLSPALKTAINAPHARPHTHPAPANIAAIYESIACDAQFRNIGLQPWLVLATAATMTLNSPDSLTILHSVASSQADVVANAELMREVGLKAISFNGIPRTINNLNAFHASLPADITSKLSTTPTRTPTPENLKRIQKAGRELWDSIYSTFSEKLLAKLGTSHPDLPVVILNSNYGPLLADPLGGQPQKVGRVLTSLAAIGCLRAQGGVGPQVISHIFGLRKAYEDGTFEAQGEIPVEGGKWLASDEGNLWILSVVDRIVEAISQGQGTTFAPGMRVKAKL